MEKHHYYRVTWNTRTRFSDRHYSRDFDTEEEAVKKARKVSENILSENVRVAEMESWETPDPAPNGTHHCSFLGFIAWWFDLEA